MMSRSTLVCCAVLLAVTASWVSPSMALCGAKCANKKSEDKAKSQCSAYLQDSKNRGRCKVSKGVTCATRYGKWRQIAKYYKAPGVIWYACVPKGELEAIHKADATATCKQYLADHKGEKCWTREVACGTGKYSIGKFGSTFSGTVYHACRDHEKGDAGKKIANTVDTVRPVVASVRAWFSAVADSATTPWRKLPRRTRRILQSHYDYPLTNIRYAMARKVPLDGLTWCYKVMFNSKNDRGLDIKIKNERWGENDYSQWEVLVHELLHGAQCARWGGEKIYVSKAAGDYIKVVGKKGDINKNAKMEREAYKHAPDIAKATWNEIRALSTR